MPKSHAMSGSLSPAPEPESLDELRGDCARMAPHWAAPFSFEPPAAGPVPPSRIHGISVPPESARLLEGMSDYGD
jgi:hypothetical protein